MYKRKISVSCLIFTASFLSVFAFYAHADSNIKFVSIDNIPADVLTAIKGVKQESLFTVEGFTEYNKQILKVDRLVFHGQHAQLRMNKMDVPFVAVFAKRIQFVDASGLFSIAKGPTPPPSKPRKPRKAAVGNPNYRHNAGSQGRNGGHGKKGAPGIPGLTKQMPVVYAFFGSMEAQKADPLSVRMSLLFPGIVGGDGGNSGDGGDGAQGERGSPGEDKKVIGVAVFCNGGPGTGGTGGNGGNTLPGAKSGDGGDGATIYMIGPPDVIEVMSYFSYRNGGAGPGSPGTPGTPGKGVTGGDMGRMTTFCRGPMHGTRNGPDGRNGSKPTKPNYGQGKKGGRGLINIVAVTSFADLLE